MRPRDLQFRLVSVICPCEKSLGECDLHRPTFLDVVRGLLPENDRGVLSNSVHPDPVKAVETALSVIAVAVVFTVIWSLLDQHYDLTFQVGRKDLHVFGSVGEKTPQDP